MIVVCVHLFPGSSVVELHKRALPGENEKNLIFILTNRVLTQAANKEERRRQAKTALELAATVILYDHGYKKVSGVYGLTETWQPRLDAAFISGADQRPLRSKHKGRTAYTDKLERSHPGYIRELYRYAERTLGGQASFEDLAQTMNNKSEVRAEQRPSTNFNTMNLFRWFHQQGGKDKSPIEKPYLTEDQKKERKKWCQDEKERIDTWGEDLYACFLNNKWFYTTSRRRKIKHLPASAKENAADVAPPLLMTRSRRHPVKVLPGMIVVFSFQLA